MNPPYSEIEPWTKKAATCGALVVVGLLPVRTDLAWFHRDVLAAGAEVRFIRGRIRFEGTAAGKGHNAPFPSMIVVWRPVSAGWVACEGCGTITNYVTCPTCGRPAVIVHVQGPGDE